MQVIAPKLPPTLQEVLVKKLAVDVRFEAVRLRGQASGAVAKGVIIDEAVLDKVSLSQAQLEKLGLSDVVMKSCDLSATSCGDGSWIRVQTTGGRMTGLDLNKCLLKDVVFEGCKLDMANFRFAKLAKVRFVDCVLTEADFGGAQLNQVEFANCLLEKTDFTQAKLSNVDARSSQLIDVRGWEYLKGLTVDTGQLMTIAPQLALALGLKVDD